MAEETEVDIPFIEFDKPTFDKIMSVYNNDIGEFAENLAGTLSNQYDDPNYLTYKGLREGTSPAFELFPSLANLSPDERKLSNEEIIKFFAYDPEGNPITGGTFMQGVKREAIPQAAAVPTFMGGFAAGQALTSGVPPVTLPTAALRFGVPLITGTLASIGGYFMGEQIADEIMGEEPPMLPGQTAAYEAGKTAMGAAAWLPLPFMVPKKLNFGVEAAKAALMKNMGDVQGPFQSTRGLKAAEFLENTVGSLGTTAAAAPKSTIAFETAAGAGATTGAAIAEENFPGATIPRLGAEFGGAVTASGVANLLAMQVKGSIGLGKGVYKAVKEGDFEKALTFISDKRQEQVRNYILDVLEESGEDVDEIIARLGSNEFTDLLVDEQGNPIQLTAALKSGSPALLALEKSLEKITTGVGKERASANVAATRALRNTITALYAMGGKEATQDAANLAQAVFENGMEQDLASAWKRVFDAYEKVGGDQERQAQLGIQLQGILDTRLNAARQNEKRLWQSVSTDFAISEFLDENGNVTNTPQFIEWMNNNLPQTEEALDDMFPNIAPLIKFVRRKEKDLGLVPSDGGDGTRPSRSPDLQRAYDTYQKSFDQFIGTDDERILRNVEDTAEGIEDINERIAYLRGQAQNLRQRASGREFDDNVSARKLATAYDRLANLELLKDREPDPDLLASGDESEFVPLTATEIYDMYSVALAKGKELTAQGKSNSARLAYGFAQALMRDLDNFDTGDAAYNTARAYTRALNDAFTRSFVGDVLQETKTGALKTAPEQIGNDIFQSDAGYLRMKQLDQVGQFELTQALTNISTNAGNPDLQKTLDRAIKYSVNEDTGLVDTARLNKWLKNNRKSLSKYPDVLRNVEQAVETTTSIRGTTESILRNIRAQAFDPDTGEVNIRQLRKWMERPENQDVLSAMPALKADLENAVTARNLLDESIATQRDETKELKSLVSFMDLLPGVTENPATAASKALANAQKKPVAAWDNLLQVVKNAPNEWTTADGVKHTKEEALQGLRSAFIEASMVKSGGSSQTFSAREFYDTIFAPHRNSENKISLSDWMLKNEVMSKQEMDRLRGLATELVKMETFVASGDMGLEELAETVGPMMDFYLRIAGASAGARLQGLIPGDTGAGSLVAAGAGSKAFRSIYSKVFADIPESLKMDVMTEMFKDPDLLATMLSKGKTESQRKNIAGRITKLLANKGFVGATAIGRRGAPPIVRETEETIVDEEPQITVPEPNPNDEASLRVLPTNPPVAQPRPVVAPAPVPQTPPPSPQTATRSRYAALFPNDPISGMINTNQGIGSLL
jgi:hypothetical protein